MHIYSIVYIASQAIHWIAQWALELIPLVKPWTESTNPPGWWYRWYTWGDWYYNLTGDYRPTATLIDLAIKGCWHLLGLWIEEVGDKALSDAKAKVRQWIGYAKAGYTTFQAWIEWLEGRVGAYTFWFAASVSEGVVWLYNRLPSEIRGLTKTWSQIWEEIKNAVKSWAQDRYDEFRTWVANTRDWITTWINTLGTWWNTAHVWLDDFRLNAKARVILWLGNTWLRLVMFERDALDFWYNLWSAHGADIGGLLSNPFQWLYDRAETWVIDQVW